DRPGIASGPLRANPPASLPALLHVGPDQLLGVLLEHLVDLVENRVHVVRQPLVAFPDFLGGLRLGLLCLFGTPGCLALSAGVLSRHSGTSVFGGAGCWVTPPGRWARPRPCCLQRYP